MRQHWWSTVKDFPRIYSLITVQNLVVVSHTACMRAHARGPKTVGDAGAPPYLDGGVGG